MLLCKHALSHRLIPGSNIYIYIYITAVHIYGVPPIIMTAVHIYGVAPIIMTVPAIHRQHS